LEIKFSVPYPKCGGKQWQTTPKKLAKDAAYQSHTGRLTGLWFLSKLAQGLNTNNKIYDNPKCIAIEPYP
jgi:hypothetical protein